MVTQPLEDPDRSFPPWFTCLPVPAPLPQLCHLPLPDCTPHTDKTPLSSSHGLTHSLPGSAGSLPQATAPRGLFLETPQILKLPCRHKPLSSRAWTPRELLTLHSHRQAHPLPPSQCQTQPGAAQPREAPSEQGNPNRIGTKYKGWPTPLFLFPLLPSLPQAS